MIKLGQKVRDKITGFEGIATSKAEYLNGCIQFCVRPRIDKEGKCQDGEYFDVEQLEPLEESINTTSTPSGGGIRNKPGVKYSG